MNGRNFDRIDGLRIVVRSILPTFSILSIFSLFVLGCFNEPEPAYKSVPAESRLYLNDRKLSDLSKTDLSKVGDYLNLDRNQLTNVNEVAKLSGLKWLRLNDNRLSSLPDLKALVKLRRIYLRGNSFESVPETLRDLPELTDIELSANPIREIPEWLAKKPGLKNLSFNRTQITALPKDLSAWKGLQMLQLGDLRIAPEEMARIRAALPGVAIVY